MNNHTDYAPLVSAAKRQIRRTLATQEPCTFEQILFEMECPGIDHLNAMPVCVLALAELMQEGEAHGWDQNDSIDDPADYTWVLKPRVKMPCRESMPVEEGIWILGRA